MSADSEAMVALHALLDERQRYEGWIRALDEHRRNSPPHVYERVRGDYVERLNDVVRRMGEHAEHLQATIDGLSVRLAQLREREEQRTEVRQEAELRAVVGEYSEDDWNRLRTEADEELNGISDERQNVERELSELQHILTMTSADSRIASQPQAASGAKADAIQRSQSSVESQVPRPTTAHASVASTPLFAAPEDEAVVKQQSEPQAEIAATAVQDEPRPETGTGEKALRCPECGTMNYATEWYCERCGGELATY